MENLFTTDGAARLLGVSRARVRSFIKDGRLTAEKRGRDYMIQEAHLEEFAADGRRPVGRPREKGSVNGMIKEEVPVHSVHPQATAAGRGQIITGDALAILPTLPARHFQLIIADPPYFQVLPGEEWDNAWHSAEEYLDWTVRWARECRRVLRPDGLLYVFGQLGRREHVWLHVCSRLAQEMQFHDMIIWDRAVGYNERHDSFTPQYEMVLALRQEANSKTYFDKDAVRIPYDEPTIRNYLRDKRYKNMEARERHLRRGKYATNILRIPSLKGASKEKIGHPSQKPVALINQLIRSGSRQGDAVLDPFLGSGTTAEAAENLARRWVGIEKNPEYTALAKKRIGRALAGPELLLP